MPACLTVFYVIFKLLRPLQSINKLKNGTQTI